MTDLKLSAHIDIPKTHCLLNVFLPAGAVIGIEHYRPWNQENETFSMPFLLSVSSVLCTKHLQMPFSGTCIDHYYHHAMGILCTRGCYCVFLAFA